MPNWFLAFCAICACFVVGRGIKNRGLYIGGAKIDVSIVVVATIIIVIAFGLIVAIKLGFIPDHSP